MHLVSFPGHADRDQVGLPRPLLSGIGRALRALRPIGRCSQHKPSDLSQSSTDPQASVPPDLCARYGGGHAVPRGRHCICHTPPAARMGWEKPRCQASSPFRPRPRPAKLMEKQGKGSQMRSVVCGVDESGSHEAVRAAVDYCRENRTDLRLIGFVKDKLSDTTTVLAGERIRRSKTVRLELDRAAEAARAAGVAVSTTLRAGNPVPELIREAAATGSSEVLCQLTGPHPSGTDPRASEGAHASFGGHPDQRTAGSRRVAGQEVVGSDDRRIAPD
jgi:hypothetical protein